MEPITAAFCAGFFLGKFVLEKFQDAGGDLIKDKFKKAIEQAARRLDEGNLPHTHQLETAFYTALGQSARCLAYRMYDPKRQPMIKLLENISDWPEFYSRFVQLAQNNIVPGTTDEYWLSDLIEVSKNPENFRDFPAILPMHGTQIVGLFDGQGDTLLRRHIKHEFLAWVNQHVSDNGRKPPDFDEKVTHGWKAGGHGDRALDFYDVFSLFFQQQLTENCEVFHAFSLDIYIGLQRDLEEIKKSLPDTETLREFTETLRTFEEKEFDANYSRFKIWTRKQNQKLYEYLETKFFGVHDHLDKQDKTLAAQSETSRVGFQKLSQFSKLAVTLILFIAIIFCLFWWQNDRQMRASIQKQEESNRRIHDLQEQIASAQKRDAPGSELLAEFREKLDESQFSTSGQSPDQHISSVLDEIAKEQGITVDELREKMLSAAKNARERLELYDELRRASASDTAQIRKGERDAYLDLAISAYAQFNFEKSLDLYLNALRFTDQTEAPQDWASFQIDVGNCHQELGVRVEGTGVSQHLQAAVVAYRAALTVYTKEGFPQAWASVQNNLCNTLRAMATQSDSPDVEEWLQEVVASYREVLEVTTKEKSPDDWAITQNNLGNALCDLARRGKAEMKVELLHEALDAYHAALSVRTLADTPQAWADTHLNLGNAFVLLAQSDTNNAVQLLDEALATYNEALIVFTPEAFPEYWARVQSNLGNTLIALARWTPGAEKVPLVDESVAAYRKALTIYTRKNLPQGWAMAQFNLGIALCVQSQMSFNDMARARRLLGDAIDAYNNALEVWTPEEFPHDHDIVSKHLAQAEEGSRELNS